MTQKITMGSLFSGSGGFELAGSIFGIRPIWASEIEPFPILVTTKNFPEMKHLGDINKLNGADLEPVTIIAGGSPCQDMSIAGKREGLDGSRSNLFREQIRIIKEMRESDRAAGRTGTQIRPRYMVWENVPGAFSSNKGKDFQAVLQEIVSITDEESNVPLPPKGKWQTAGCIMGDHFTIAWRVLDAQYWGVPQRRKRIYLVADFGGNTAPKILFEREGLSGNFTESREAWQRTAGDIKTGTHKTGTDDVECYDISDRRRVADKREVSPTLTTKMGTGGNNVPIVLENHPQDSRVTIIQKEHSIAYRVTKDEALDLPEQTFLQRYITMSAKEKNIYDRIKRESFAELESGGQISATTVLTKLLRLQQFTGGFLVADGEEKPELVSKGKLNALEEIVDDYVVDAGKKLVIFARFRPEIDIIGQMLKKKKLRYGEIYGDVKLEDRGDIVKDFQTNPETMVFLAQIDTAGLGITLTAADTCVYYSVNFNYAAYSQSLARIHRIGQKNACTYIHLITEGTIDEVVLKALAKKEDLAKTVVDTWRDYF